MNLEKYSKAELRWHNAIHSTVVDILKDKLTKISDHELFSRRRILWRIGLQLFKAGRFEESIDNLMGLGSTYEAVLKSLKKIQKFIYKITFYRVYLTMGRASVQLFLANHDIKYLEDGYKFYQEAIGMVYMEFIIPDVLSEFGRLLEHYGAFEASLEMYHRLLSNFPSYKFTTQVMLRSAMVGRHLAALTTNEKEREKTLKKCIEILKELVEKAKASTDVSEISF